MPDYPIPPRNSGSTTSFLIQALKPVAVLVLRQLIFLLGLLWIAAFVPFVYIGLTLYGIFMLGLVALITVYTRLTGRRVDWVERVLPFGRTIKMSPDELKKRKLGGSD